MYNAFYPMRERYGDLSNPARARRLLEDIYYTDVFRDWDHRPDIDEVLNARKSDDFHGLFDALLHCWAAHHGKPRWGEKSPQHAPYWPTIREAFPDAQVIHIVRDCRDVVLSWVAARFGPKHIAVAAERWQSYLRQMQEIKAMQPTDGFYTVRYVDLVSQPESELKKLCAFLGEAYDPKMLNFYQEDYEYVTDKRNARKLQTPLNTSSVGRWEDRLTARQVGVIEWIAGEMMDFHGYPRSSSETVPVGSVARISYQACNKFLRAKAMAVNTKGWVDTSRRAVIRARLTLNPPG